MSNVRKNRPKTQTFAWGSRGIERLLIFATLLWYTKKMTSKMLRCIFMALMVCLMAVLSGSRAVAQYDIDRFYFRGQQSLLDGKYADAISNYNVIIRLDGKQYEAYFFRGIAKYNLGDFSGAESDFDTAIELNPLYTLAYHYRAITKSRTGNYQDAIKDLEEAVELRPGYYGVYFSRGVTYFLSQQFDKAVEDFNRFIKYETKEADAYLNRGAAYLFLGDTALAISDYNRAIYLDNLEPEGYIRRSRIYHAQGEFEKALADLDYAVDLDTTNTFAYFNRALIRYELKDFDGTLRDFEKVLSREPDNALTLYNRALIRSQLGDYTNALDDYDRVLNINPDNVLALYNRSILFSEMGRYSAAVRDLTRAIELYPDFANAYMTRSYVKNQMGRHAEAEEDYKTGQEKVARYRASTSDSTGRAAFADTSKKYDRLLALDSDFARSDFNEELLQNRKINISLKPLYKFVVLREESDTELPTLLKGAFEDNHLEAFMQEAPLEIRLASIADKDIEPVDSRRLMEVVQKELAANPNDDIVLFVKALIEAEMKQFNSALASYDGAITANPEEVFYYMNRGALQSEMIDFISSVESNVQVLSLDNAGTARARVRDGSSRSYDYTAALLDMNRAAQLAPEFPYTWYNLGNIYCQSGEMLEAIAQYTRAIELYPALAEAYYNRGLVLIYLKDREKGCIDMSKAGELGIPDAYSVIKKYCSETL